MKEIGFTQVILIHFLIIIKTFKKNLPYNTYCILYGFFWFNKHNRLHTLWGYRLRFNTETRYCMLHTLWVFMKEMSKFHFFLLFISKIVSCLKGLSLKRKNEQNRHINVMLLKCKQKHFYLSINGTYYIIENYVLDSDPFFFGCAQFYLVLKTTLLCSETFNIQYR